MANTDFRVKNGLTVDGIITGKAVSSEGGEIDLNNPDNASIGLYVDVSTADVGRIFSVRNNSTLQLGQLQGTGGIVTMWTAGSERVSVNASGVVIVGSGEGGATPVGNTIRAPSGAGTNIAGANLTITSGNGTGTGGSGNILFQTAPAGSTGASANTMATAMTITTGGAVGIGLTIANEYSRSWNLVVRKDQNATTQIGVINNNTGALAVSQITKVTGTGNSFIDWGLWDNAGSPYDLFAYGTAVTYTSWSYNGTERMRLTSGGNLIVGSNEASVTPVGNTIRAPSGAGANIVGGDLTITAGNGTGTGGSGNIYFQTAPGGSSGASADTMATRLTISPAGLVKISAPALATTYPTISTTGTVGTITGSGPWGATITGMSSTTGLVAGSFIYATNGVGSLGGGGTYVVSGIPSGTSITFTATGGTIPLAGAITNILTNPTTNLLELSNNNGNANYLRISQIRNAASPADWTTATTRIQQVTDITQQAYIDFNPINGNYGLAFGTSGSIERMRIDSSGNVGIGTTNPSAPGGTINFVTSSNNITVVKSQTTSTTTGYARFDLATGTANSYTLISVQDNTASPYFQLASGSGVLNHYYDGPNHIFRNVAGTARMTIDSSGNVGIGTSSNLDKLTVAGGIKSTSNINTAAITANSTFVDNLSGARMLSYGPNTTTNGTFVFYQGKSDNSSGQTAMSIDASGNVGINTSPSYKLDVNGTLNFATSLYIGGKLNYYGGTDGTATNGQNRLAAAVYTTGNMLYRDPTFKNGTNGITVYDNNSTGQTTIVQFSSSGLNAPNNSGYVLKVVHAGSGQTPGYGGFTFQTQSRANATLACVFKAKIASGYTLTYAANTQGTGGVNYWATDNVGTGKWEDYVFVQRCGDGGSFSTGMFFSVSGSPTPSAGSPLTWYIASATVYDLDEERTSPVSFTTSATAPVTPTVGDFWYKSGSDILYQYAYDGTSNFWISLNTYPSSYSNLSVTSALTVSGSVSSNLVPSVNNSYNLGSASYYWANIYGTSSYAKYADLAEKYTSDIEIIPGQVVVFGGEKEVTLTDEYADTRIAGVVSTDPGFLMNSKLEDGYPIAMTGRVPCYVMGPIAKGDIVTSSNIKGVAIKLKKGDFLPGCIIGKSLEEHLDETVKVIEVVVGRF